MNDRLLNGTLAGLLGGIVMNAANLFAYHVLRITTLRHYDWVGQVLYGHLPRALPDRLFALIIHLLWTAGVGVFFAYLAPLVTTRYRLFRGAAFGVGLWMLVTSLSYVIQTPNPLKVNWTSNATNLVTATLLGLTIAWVLDWLEERAWQKDS